MKIEREITDLKVENVFLKRTVENLTTELNNLKIQIKFNKETVPHEIDIPSAIITALAEMKKELKEKFDRLKNNANKNINKYL